jgi:predicted RNase H-like nuclease
MTTSVVGFDSAWTDNPKAPGAISVIRLDAQGARLHMEPRLASFSEAAALIHAERLEVDKCVVALDQPTIVPNLSGSRPVDKVAGALISWVGGGVQPANRSKLGMFDEAAPIWRFKHALGAIEDPELARTATSGTFLLEVFPALALSSIETTFCSRLAAPKYNPANRKQFKIKDWQAVAEVVRRFGRINSLQRLDDWCSVAASSETPRKADQDRLDALICGLIGLHWLVAPRDQSVMIGDPESGYMIAPATNGIHERLHAAALQRNVPIR